MSKALENYANVVGEPVWEYGGENRTAQDTAAAILEEEYSIYPGTGNYEEVLELLKIALG
jgi:hypothetical protein